MLTYDRKAENDSEMGRETFGIEFIQSMKQLTPASQLTHATWVYPAKISLRMPRDAIDDP